MPVTPVQLENVVLPDYLEGFRVLLLTYHGMKPLSPDVHRPLGRLGEARRRAGGVRRRHRSLQRRPRMVEQRRPLITARRARICSRNWACLSREGERPREPKLLRESGLARTLALPRCVRRQRRRDLDAREPGQPGGECRRGRAACRGRSKQAAARTRLEVARDELPAAASRTVRDRGGSGRIARRRAQDAPGPLGRTCSTPSCACRTPSRSRRARGSSSRTWT